jgi:immunoglobulin-binding protein 1
MCIVRVLKFLFYFFSYVRWHLPTADNTKCLQQLSEAPEPEQEDKVDKINEEEEENERQRLNARDEYKDNHRRGWGNRHNRS